jgi:hypothetical protein
MPSSSLEERVRELCAQVTAAKTETELRVVLPQLQAAIHDHIRHLRAVAAEVPFHLLTLTRKEGMLVIVVVVIVTIVLLISMDRVSSRQTTNGRSLKAAEDRFLNRFLHSRRPKP